MTSVAAAAVAAAPGPVAILDDDPTGTQEVVDTPVLLDWSGEVLERLTGRPFHVITNTRARSPEAAYRITREVTAGVVHRFPQAQVVLRGDSTLRAHLREEYEAVRDVVYPGETPTLLLVPALPAAGRVTVNGVHLIERDGRRTPLHDTEFATDGAFSYRTARLLKWAEERSGGLFRAAAGTELPLPTLRAGGPGTVRARLTTSPAGRGGFVCAPDAETVSDLRMIAEGLQGAQADGARVIVRCAPTFAALVAGTLARTFVAAPRARRLLVVCGSYVQQTTRQLRALLDRYPSSLVELPLGRFGRGEGSHDVERVVSRARELLRTRRLAVVATPRTRTSAADDPAAAGVISAELARATELLADDAELILFKGGITSAVGVRDGLGSSYATVEGPVMPGVSLWRLSDGRHCLIFPGNVGGDNALVNLVNEVLR